MAKSCKCGHICHKKGKYDTFAYEDGSKFCVNRLWELNVDSLKMKVNSINWSDNDGTITTVADALANSGALGAPSFARDYGSADGTLAYDHYKRIADADITYPILIDRNYQMIDGCHRLAKTVKILGKNMIKCRIVRPKILDKAKI